MKSMKFLALSILSVAQLASAKINLSLGLMRNESVATAANIQLSLDQREICYQDATTFIEAEVLEENAESVLIQFTIATKNETGAYMVRGLPKLSFNIDPETKTGTSSLRCESPLETFNLIATIYNVDETAPVVTSVE